jgi:hypothetical protein
VNIRVLNTFREVEHENTIYEVGSIYPKEGFKADKNRVAFLQEIHPQYKVRFLGPTEGDSKDAKVSEKKPTVRAPKNKSDAK